MELTRVKVKISGYLGPRWTLRQLAIETGAHFTAISREVRCTGEPGCRARHTPQVQEAIAKALHVAVSKLFGPHAWSRLSRRTGRDRRERALMRRRATIERRSPARRGPAGRIRPIRPIGPIFRRKP